VTPLARLQGEYQPLVVAAESPLKSLDDLVSKFKADPGSVSWGGFALGSPDHILSGMIVKAIGGDVTKMNYIVAGAGGEMLAQVMGGHITVATGGLNEFAQQIASGKLRALAISSPERLPGVDIPTFKEQGVDVELVNWRGLMAPANIRPADKKALDDALGKMVKTAAWQALLKERGWVDAYLPSDRFATFVEGEQARIAGLLKDLGLVQ
jgi:putative tricarboxylic transport membrane protein